MVRFFLPSPCRPRQAPQPLLSQSMSGTRFFMAKVKLKYVNSFRDRHGKLRHQMRVPGAKSFQLPGLPGSEEFMGAYQTGLARNSVHSVAIGSTRTKPGTM